MSPTPLPANPPELPVLAHGDVRLFHVATPEACHRWRAGFIGAFQAVCAGPPFNERYSPDEADAVWRRLTRSPEHVTVLAVGPSENVIGYALGVPLSSQRDLASQLDGLVSVPRTFFFAELGVLPRHRGRGIGTALVHTRLHTLDARRFQAIVLRAPVPAGGNYPIFTKLGFEEMGVSSDVRTLRTDGRVSADRRAFLYCVLSQIRLDDTRTID
ncbi:MAG: GNAT family N-acetyltransferase [Deltaproteobacteria bacterium]|nr:MAG: GNAT family N-acetyltransferase [Deltaproteobacteria bacterium]